MTPTIRFHAIEAVLLPVFVGLDVLTRHTLGVWSTVMVTVLYAAALAHVAKSVDYHSMLERLLLRKLPSLSG